MKFLLISDLHLTGQNPIARKDDLTTTQWDKFEYILKFAEDNDCAIIQAGDWHDKPRSYNVLVKELKLLNKYNHLIYAIMGQHDQYYRSSLDGATNFGILSELENFNFLVRNEFWHRGTGMGLYGCSWGEEIPSIYDKEKINILAIHAPISDVPLFYNHDYTSAEKFLKKHKDFDLILCGDIHRKFVIQDKNRYLVNTGSMLRSTADEYNFTHEPCFYIYDTKTRKLKKHIIPHKPAGEVLSKKHLEQSEKTKEMLNEFTKEVDEQTIDSVDLYKNIWEFCKNNKIKPEVENIISEIAGRGDE